MSPVASILKTPREFLTYNICIHNILSIVKERDSTLFLSHEILNMRTAVVDLVQFNQCGSSASDQPGAYVNKKGRAL